jgi:glutathione peroxidase-family protein
LGITILYEDRILEDVQAKVEGGHVWLFAPEFASVTGWTPKPEGLCRDSACVQLPRDGSWTDAEGRIDLTAFAERFNRPLVCDDDHSVWAFGDSVEGRGDQLESTLAPDFTLPDIDGVAHALADFRGKKVLLMSWGSYCGCRADLPVWEVLYRELRDDGFEIVAVALDTGGAPAVEPHIRCEDLSETSDALRSVMGWSEDLWRERSAPTYTCLVDQEHLVADLYGMNNVPVAVWINEEGRIVRPAEPAGATDNHRQLDPQTFELPDSEVERLASNRRRYWDAVRDWVRHGDASKFALSPEEVRATIKRPDANDVTAAVHARVGRYLFDRGDTDSAKAHLREAVKLCPAKWNYRRQSMVLDPEMVGELNAGSDFFEAVAALGSQPYYDKLAMEGIQNDPLVVSQPGANGDQS